jgi:hypothetical protein
MVGARWLPCTDRPPPAFARADHSYYFIQTFAADHVDFHADALFALPASKKTKL